jgi:thymidylate synthase
LLLELLAKHCGRQPGKLCGFLGDVHIYENHVDQAKVQLSRTPLSLPKLQLSGSANILEWEFHMASLSEYENHGKLNFEMLAV